MDLRVTGEGSSGTRSRSPRRSGLQDEVESQRGMAAVPRKARKTVPFLQLPIRVSPDFLPMLRPKQSERRRGREHPATLRSANPYGDLKVTKR